MYIDEHGNAVEKSKDEYPYSYDGFVQERNYTDLKANGTVYTDRLLQWDFKLTRELIKKYFKDGGGDYWENRSLEDIQSFLRERLNKPELIVTLVMEYCNVSTGFPVWRIDYWEDKN